MKGEKYYLDIVDWFREGIDGQVSQIYNLTKFSI